MLKLEVTAPVLARDWSCALTERHRRRRLSACLADPEASPRDSPCGDASPSELPHVSSPCPSPPPSPLPADLALPLSPLTCPSPAMFVREDLIQKNARSVHAEYEFGRCLGAGSFGQVHEAVHKRTGARRAVKEIHKSGTETAEFEWELQALVALDHPHIIKVIEWFDDEDNYYIVMELCTGPDLSTYVLQYTESEGTSGFVPEREVSIILRQCLKAVLCCHANGFVHRDLNAKNFMFTGSDRTLKMIDLGLATRFKGFVPHDRFIEIVGTSHYMAPEMMLEGQYSPAVDMWSLGVLLYVLLTGMMLLPKDDERKVVLLKRPGYITRRIKNCKALQKREASPRVLDLLGQLLEREPEKRISASGALSHPFILGLCHENLVPRSVALGPEFDSDIIAKLRRFGKAPRLKKVALLSMAHLADHERGLTQARRTFRVIDRDGDGHITLQDIKESIAERGIEAPLDMDEVFAACDSDSSGKLTFVEFLACLLPAWLVDERLCHEAFNLLDKESYGRLDAKALQASCPCYDIKRCEKMVSQADLDGKGYFDFQDFHILLRGADNVVRERPRLLARKTSEIRDFIPEDAAAPC